MKNNFVKISAILLSFIVIAAPSFVFAQIENPLKSASSIPEFISSVLVYIVRIGGIIAIFAFIWSGYLFVRAQGNPKALEDAKTVFINTCIGTAVLLGAQLIASIIVGTIKSIK